MAENTGVAAGRGRHAGSRGSGDRPVPYGVRRRRRVSAGALAAAGMGAALAGLAAPGAHAQELRGTVTIESGQTYTNDDLLDASVVNEGTFINNSRVTGTVASAGTLSNSGEIAMAVSNSGDASNAGTINSTVANSGIWTGTGSINGDVTNSGTFSGSQGIVGNVVNSASLTNGGSIAGTVTNSATMTNAGLVNGAVSNEAGASFDQEGQINGNVTNAGTWSGEGQVNGVVTNSGTYANGGQITGGVVNSGGFTNAGVVNGPIDNSGTLALKGTVNGTLTNTGTASGTGTLNGTFDNAGLYETGAAGFATFRVGGDVAFRAGSTYVVKVGGGGASDLIAASGALALSGGTVSFVASDGFAPGIASYTVVTADGGVTGTFAGVSNPFGAGSAYPFLGTSLAYGAKSVAVVVGHVGGVSFSAAGLTANQTAAGRGADGLPLSSPLLASLVLLDFGTAPAALDAISGEIYASVKTVMQQQSLYVRQAVLGRMRGGDTGTPVDATTPVYPGGPGIGPRPLAPGFAPTVWAEGYGGSGSNDGDGNAASLTSSTAGGLIGIDTALLDGPMGGLWRLGIASGYGRSNFSADARQSSGSFSSYSLAGYAGVAYGDLALRFGVAQTWQGISIDRTVSFTGFDGTNHAGYDGGTTQVFGEAGYRFTIGAGSVEPYAGLAFVNASTDGLLESGSAAALKAGSQSTSNLYSTLGARFAIPFAAGFALRADIAWQHAFEDVSPEARLAFASGGADYTVTGAPIARDALLVGAGLSYDMPGDLTVALGYSGQLSSTARENAVRGAVSVRF